MFASAYLKEAFVAKREVELRVQCQACLKSAEVQREKRKYSQFFQNWDPVLATKIELS
jgi:hypothetical protein